MALGDIVALGVGSPADIAHNVLFGLSPNPGGSPFIPPTSGGGYPITRNSLALLHRDYRPADLPKRIRRIHGLAQPDGVCALARMGVARAVGRLGVVPGKAQPDGLRVRARAGEAVAGGAAVATVTRRQRLSPQEWFVLGLTAGSD